MKTNWVGHTPTSTISSCPSQIDPESRDSWHRVTICSAVTVQAGRAVAGRVVARIARAGSRAAGTMAVTAYAVTGVRDAQGVSSVTGITVFARNTGVSGGAGA